MSRPRDSQRQKVYNAESVLVIHRKDFKTLDEIKNFVDKVFARKMIAKRYDVGDKITFVLNSGRISYASYYVSTISLSRMYGMNDWIVLHEMAHLLAFRKYGTNIAGHGWQFVSTYLDLVLRIMGKSAHDDLLKSFKNHKVKFKEPRAKRVLTEEQREILVARMAKARAAKKKTI
jgi:putative metallohydrolase (TIGR04338 family)